jgi:hypothetical protein
VLPAWRRKPSPPSSAPPRSSSVLTSWPSSSGPSNRAHESSVHPTTLAGPTAAKPRAPTAARSLPLGRICAIAPPPTLHARPLPPRSVGPSWKGRRASRHGQALRASREEGGGGRKECHGRAPPPGEPLPAPPPARQEILRAPSRGSCGPCACAACRSSKARREIQRRWTAAEAMDGRGGGGWEGMLRSARRSSRRRDPTPTRGCR